MKTYKKTSSIYFVWLAIFVIVPLLMIIYYAFQDGDGQLSLAQFQRFFSSSSLITLFKSVRIAGIATILCLLLAYPVAYIMSRMKTRFQPTAMMLVVIPMWMNFLLRTYSWITILSRNGILNQFLESIGLSKMDMLYTEGAVILGMVYNFLPFMILPIYTALEKMDQSLIEAAADLGANKVQTFTKVIFPLSLPGVASGISMVFIPALSTFEITMLLGGNKTNLIGNIIEQQFTVTGNWSYGSAMAVILMVFLVISLIISKDEDAQVARPTKAEKLVESVDQAMGGADNV